MSGGIETRERSIVESGFGTCGWLAERHAPLLASGPLTRGIDGLAHGRR